MKVLVIGSGGRESAIAWACRRHGHDATIAAELPADVSADLVIVGPETALANGISDECVRRGVASMTFPAGDAVTWKQRLTP